MVTDKVTDNSHSSLKAGRGRQLLSLVVALVFALMIYPPKAHAQLEGTIEANIPFQFYAGNAKLPAGNYALRVLDNSDMMFMEISSADGSTSALFEIGAAQANSAPAKTELIFNKYGGDYFLAKVFDEGNQYGSDVVKSRYEKDVSKGAAPGQEHVSAHHRGRQGS